MSAALDALARGSLVQIRRDRTEYLGVGFVIAPELVVTNAHVAEDSLEVWFDGTAYECTRVHRFPEEKPRGREWAWPDLAELTVPGLPAEPVLLGPAFTEARDIEQLGEVRVPTFDLADVRAGPEGLRPITKRLTVTITGDGLLGLGGGTLDLGMSGSPVIDMRSGRVRGVVKSAAWAQAQVRGGALVPAGGWMIPLTGAHTPPSWFGRNATANPLGNPWRRAAADAERVQQDLFRRAEPPEEITPANLLDPDTGVVPFEPMSELEELLAWCRAETRTVVRLISGTSGAGKTRIAHELCDRLREEGWAAGFLRPAFRDADWLRTLARALARELQVGIVVDDAEHRGTDVAAILQEVSDAVDAASSTGLRVTARVVLLSRNDPDRFEEEFLSIDIDDDVFARWIRSVQEPPILLPRVLPDPPAVLSRAWRAFTSRLGLRADAEPLWPRDLSEPTTLDLYAIAVDEALSALPGFEQDHRGAQDPLETIRRHQLRYWVRKLKDAEYQLRSPPPRARGRPRAGRGPIDLPLATAEAWLLVPTLASAADPHLFRRVMSRAALALDAPGPGEVDNLLLLYPAAAGRPVALAPDRLAEIVFRHVCRELDEFTLCAFLAAVLVGEGADALLALRLICRSRADPETAGDAAHDRIDAAVTTLLAEHPRELLPALTRVCGEVPHMAPLVGLLTAAAQDSDLDVMRLVEGHLPDDGRGLSPLALVVLQRQVDATPGNDDGSLIRRVSWWRKLSLHQYHVGRNEVALDTNQDAINECRVLRARGGEHAAMFARLHGDRALFLLQQVRARRAHGDINEALTNGKIAIAEYETLGREHETALADVMHNQDILCAVAERSDQALEYGRKALDLYGETGPRRSRAAAHLQVADDLRRMGRLDEALGAADRGVAILTGSFREAPSAYAADLVRAFVLRTLVLLQRGVNDQREGEPGASGELIAARHDLAQARQVMRRWSPVPEPGLDRLLRNVEAVLARRMRGLT